MSNSIDTVKAYFASLGRTEEILEFSVSSATVELAAQALSVEPAMIAKTLSFESGDGCLLLVAAGDARVDNVKFRGEFGFKARMLSPDRVEALTGHTPGGVCPFALPQGVRVFTDISLLRFPAVYPACGSDHSAVRLTCDNLFTLSGSLKWVDVCKGWPAEPLASDP
ncbi:YbaK/EbsC family protein [Papillibacter cinnamivorans]|uniref:Cys-tRNA(Pro) deacylase, prolyl-tRNA editing enzyme YbaK/EbsC n=1 Tax=Papillibacter cinnamivorans DSM 12816 TaxID=1122930 RepID=A0A1W2CBC0_9FIRM|nr:YbaK/EbsC family protein [Papillibacter cinnamivorans]SMC81948.1 Cys-tRNA(Pro) deacylase, prolyl-tRNA editing enzyme YbaK/EbsC [Papillibacter cinnamivorans DSM 12816]